MDVDHAGVRRAFRKAGDKLEAERQQRIADRNAKHIAAGGKMCGTVRCTRPATTRLASGAHVCATHCPPQPQPGCSKPLLCYKPCCASKLPELQHDVQRRHAVAVDQQTWMNELRQEIERLARSGAVFTLAELAEYGSRGRRDRVVNVLDAAVTHGLIEKHPTKDQWRGKP